MSDQFILTLTLVILLGFFIWGRFRYDAISMGALVALVILGVIPSTDAFLGFAHPAVITVALVLIISQGLKNSGLTGLVGKLIGGKKFTEFQFLISLLFIAAFLSSFINNIGALAILLPITLNICQRLEWHPAKFLMPLSFACILGGMNTAIGTPPNIIISEYKASISSMGFNFLQVSDHSADEYTLTDKKNSKHDTEDLELKSSWNWANDFVRIDINIIMKNCSITVESTKKLITVM